MLEMKARDTIVVLFGSFGATFWAGVMASQSGCVLALVPVYLSWTWLETLGVPNFAANHLAVYMGAFLSSTCLTALFALVLFFARLFGRELAGKALAVFLSTSFVAYLALLFFPLHDCP